MIPVPVYDEKLVIDWLLAQTAITDLPSGSQGWTILPGPDKLTFPLWRCIRVGGTPPSTILWADEALLQFDAWANNRAHARLIADTLRQQLASGLVGVHALGVVTQVRVGGLRWLPDTEFTPAKPRFSFDASVSLHPPE